MTPARNRSERAPVTPIVGLGASAGGLTALEQFLAHVPPASGLAYIVVQHLDPTQKAMLAQLLQRATAMPVREATDSTRIEGDAVYVIPPNTELTVAGGMLHLADPLQPRGMRLPIDVLFCSLARELGDSAIGVVLSGMGSDGTVGLQAIKARGGLTLAQLPESAQFDSMPRSAIVAGAADIVAPPAELPQRILQVSTGWPSGAWQAPDDAGDSPHALGNILALLRDGSKHDMTLYKPSTLKRRIERRMGVHGLDTMSGYEEFLRRNSQELDLLFKEMLIGVTGFFRDPAVWQDMKDAVLPALLAGAASAASGASAKPRAAAADQAPLRAWVVGCSTGEEAYSLAMVFREVVDALPEHGNPANPTLQIFATDLSADAIAVARRGVYGAAIAASVGPQRLERFFSAQGDGFLIDKRIRAMVLFAQHDVILDPPFTRVDILSCRNLMIYFSAQLQRRLIPLFHYSLRPGGVLVLGPSETVGASHGLFTALGGKSRFYWRSAAAAGAIAVDFPINRRLSPRPLVQESTVSNTGNPAINLQALADQLVIQELSPPTVLVNQHGDIVYISGRTGKYLEPAAGKANWNIHVMARPALRPQLTAALRLALQDRKTVELRGLRLEYNAHDRVDVTVRAILEPRALDGTVMIVFRDVVAPASRLRRKSAPATGDAALDAAASEQLARSQAEILALRQEMGASQEELQATNEELQSTNEELQSANEELTTSKEEAQSMNEELQTVNQELQSRLDDLALAQSDMQNLLNSTDIATLFLDEALNVRRFTERIKRIINLRESDIGRPLSDLASTLIYPELAADARETLRTLAYSERQVATTDGQWFAVRIMPYRTLANVIQGAVVTLVDITAAKELEARLRNV